MPGIEKSGNATHDAAVLASEKTLQAALAGNPSQATINSSTLTHLNTVTASAITNGLTSQASYYGNAARALAARGSNPP